MRAGRRFLSVFASLALTVTVVAGIKYAVSADEANDEGWDVVYIDVEDVEITECEEASYATAADTSYWDSMSSKYYYYQLSDNQKKLYDALYDRCNYYLVNDNDIDDYIYDSDAFIIISCYDIDLSEDDAYDVLLLFRYSEPQFFYLDSSLGISSYSDGTASAAGIKVYPEFVSGSDRAAARNKVKSAVDGYVNAAASYSLPEQKEHVVVELMSKNITYVDNYYDQSIYSAVLGKTVCAGYTMMFTAVMNRMGIETLSDISYEHAWNIINLHGYWYYVDVTWADVDDYNYVDYKYYDMNVSSDDPEAIFKNLLPKIEYDVLENNNSYSSRYFTSDGVTYFIANDISSGGRRVVPVSGTSTVKSITYGGKTYTVEASANKGWIKENNSWFYYDNSGTKVTGWRMISDDWYYFNTNGEMQKGWQLIGGYWYYFGGNGIMREGWTAVNGKWYYLKGGRMLTGEYWEKGNWYYFRDDGSMVTGWLEKGGKWYYFDANGVKVFHSWRLVNGSWYFFDTGDGYMLTGWQQVDGFNWYYFGSNGAMKTGWQLVNGKWYYLDASGIMKTGWIQVGGNWYYLDSNGVMLTGWYYGGGNWFYLDTNGVMVTGTKVINGKEYKFDSTGKCTNP